MIKGFAVKDLPNDGWEILVFDREKREAYTFQFTVTKAEEGAVYPTTKINHRSMDMLRGLGESLIEMGIMVPNDASTELKATKYHLEDMRKIAFNELSL